MRNKKIIVTIYPFLKILSYYQSGIVKKGKGVENCRLKEYRCLAKNLLSGREEWSGAKLNNFSLILGVPIKTPEGDRRTIGNFSVLSACCKQC